MVKKKHPKKKRQQPRPKKKKVASKITSYTDKTEAFKVQMRAMGMKLIEFFKNTEAVNTVLREQIDVIEGYFRKYDTIQLLGSIGLYLIENLPNFEKHFIAQICGSKIELDEKAEVLAEYALNFGLSMSNEGREQPNDDVVKDLKDRLRTLYYIYLNKDMPLIDDSEQSINWMIHMDTIAVRGDGYQCHVYEVFKEMFYPHSDF